MICFLAQRILTFMIFPQKPHLKLFLLFGSDIMYFQQGTLIFPFPYPFLFSFPLWSIIAYPTGNIQTFKNVNKRIKNESIHIQTANCQKNRAIGAIHYSSRLIINKTYFWVTGQVKLEVTNEKLGRREQNWRPEMRSTTMNKAQSTDGWYFKGMLLNFVQRSRIGWKKNKINDFINIVNLIKMTPFWHKNFI